MDAEKLIISKQYVELTPSELKLVSGYVENEAEFDEMKTFLLSTQQSFNQQKIKSTPDLDEKILAHLHSNVTPTHNWYKSLMLFLFPRDKHIYQYPAFQMTIASVLVIGFLNLFNTDRLKGESLAFEDVSVVEEENTFTDEQNLKNEIPAEIEKLESSEDNLGDLTLDKDDEKTPISLDVRNLIELNEEQNKQEDLANDVINSVSFEPVLDDAVEADADVNPVLETYAYTVAEEEKSVSNLENEEILEETPNESIVNAVRQDKEVTRKKKEKDLKSKTTKPNAPSQNITTSSGTTAYNVSDTASPIQKISIKNSNELLELFFEVK